MSNGKVSVSDFSQPPLSDSNDIEGTGVPMNHPGQSNTPTDSGLEFHAHPTASSSSSLCPSFSSASVSISIVAPAPSADRWNPTERFSKVWCSPYPRLTTGNRRTSPNSAQERTLREGLPLEPSLRADNSETRGGTSSSSSGSSSPNAGNLTSSSAFPSDFVVNDSEYGFASPSQHIITSSPALGEEGGEMGGHATGNTMKIGAAMPSMVSSLPMSTPSTNYRLPYTREAQNFTTPFMDAGRSHSPVKSPPHAARDESGNKTSIEVSQTSVISPDNEQRLISVSPPPSPPNRSNTSLAENAGPDNGDEKENRRHFPSSVPALVGDERVLFSTTDTLLTSLVLPSEDIEQRRNSCTCGNNKNSRSSHSSFISSSHREEISTTALPFSLLPSPREASGSPRCTAGSDVTSTVASTTPALSNGNEKKKEPKKMKRSSHSTISTKTEEVVSSASSPARKPEESEGDHQSTILFPSDFCTLSSAPSSSVPLRKTGIDLLPSAPSPSRQNPAINENTVLGTLTAANTATNNNQRNLRENGTKKKGTKAPGNVSGGGSSPSQGGSSPHSSSPTFRIATSNAGFPVGGTFDGKSIPLQPLATQKQQLLQHQTTINSTLNSPTGNGPSKSSSPQPTQPLTSSSHRGTTNRANAWIQTDPTPISYVGIGSSTGFGESFIDATGILIAQPYSIPKTVEPPLQPSSNMALAHHTSPTTTALSASTNSGTMKSGGGRGDMNRNTGTTSNTSNVPSFLPWRAGGGGSSGTQSIDPFLLQISEMPCLNMFSAYVECCLGTCVDDYEARRQVFEDVQAMAKFQFGMKADAHVYGSVTTDLALPNSDIDLLITGYHPHSPLDAIQALSGVLLEVDEKKLLEIKASVIQSARKMEVTSAGEGSDIKSSGREHSDWAGDDEHEQSEAKEHPLVVSPKAETESGEDKHMLLRTNITTTIPPLAFSRTASPSNAASTGVSPHFASISTLLQSSLDKVVPEDEAFVNPDSSQEKEQYFFPEELESAEEVYRNQIEKDYTFSTIGDYTTLWQNSRSTAISASTGLSKGTNTTEVTPAPVVPLMAKIATTEKFRRDQNVDSSSEKKYPDKVLVASASSSCSSTTPSSPCSLDESQRSHTSAGGLVHTLHSSNPNTNENVMLHPVQALEEVRTQGKEERGLSTESTTGASMRASGVLESSQEAGVSPGAASTNLGANHRRTTTSNHSHVVLPGVSRRGVPSYYTFVPTLDGPLYRVQTITSARVPVIKLTNKNTNQRADITFGGGEHFRSLQMTRTLLEVFPPSRSLIRFLKNCVGRMGIGELTPGGVTSFSIYLMVRHLYNILLKYIANRYCEFEAHMMEVPDLHNCNGSGVTGANAAGGWSGGVDGGLLSPQISSMLAPSLYSDVSHFPSSTSSGEVFNSIPPPTPASYDPSVGSALPLSPGIIDEVDMFVKIYYEKWGRFQQHQHLFERLHQEDVQYEQHQHAHPDHGSPSVPLAPSSVGGKHGIPGASTVSEKELVPDSVEGGCFSSPKTHLSSPSSFSSPFSAIAEKEERGKKTNPSSVRGGSKSSNQSSSTSHLSTLAEVEGDESDERKQLSSGSRETSNSAAPPLFSEDPRREDEDHGMGSMGSTRQIESTNSSSSLPPAGMIAVHPAGNKDGITGILTTTTRSSTGDAGDLMSNNHSVKIGLPTPLLSSSSSSPSSFRMADDSALKHQIDGDISVNGEENGGGGFSVLHYEIAAMIIREQVSFTTILRDFCAYYGCIFNYEGEGIRFSSDGSSEVIAKPFICSRRGQLFHMTSPFNPNYDLTARMTCMREFQWMCEYFSTVVIPSFSLYTFLMWLHPPTAHRDLFAMGNYLLHHQTNLLENSSGTMDEGTEMGEGGDYPLQPEAAARRPPPIHPNQKKITPASGGSSTEEGDGVEKGDGGSPYYYSTSQPSKGSKHQTPPPRGKNPENLNNPSSEKPFLCAGRSEEMGSSQQNMPSQPPQPSPSHPAMGHSPRTPSHTANLMRRNSLHETQSSLSTDGQPRMGGGNEGVEHVRSPPSNVSFSSSPHGGGNPQVAFPMAPSSSSPVASAPAANHGGGKNSNGPISHPPLGPGGAGSAGGGAISHVPLTASSHNGFLSMTSHPSTPSGNTASAGANNFQFSVNNSQGSTPFITFVDNSLQKSFVPYSGIPTSTNGFPRYLYTGEEGRNDGVGQPSRIPNTADFMHSPLPGNNVPMPPGNVNGRGVGGEGMPSGGYAGSLPMFHGSYPQYFDPMQTGAQPSGAGVWGVSNSGNTEMMMRLLHQAHHRNANTSNIPTGAMGGGGRLGTTVGPGAGVPFHMTSSGMMPSGVQLLNMGTHNGMNGSGGGSNNATNNSNNSNNNNNNNNNSAGIMPVVGSPPSATAHNFSFPNRSGSNKADGNRHRQPNHPRSHPHNSNKIQLPPPPPPPPLLPSTSHHHHNGIPPNSGIHSNSSGGSSTSSNLTGGNKVHHNGPVNPLFTSNTNHHLVHHATHNHIPHQVGVGRRSGGDSGGGVSIGSFTGYHQQQHVSFPSAVSQPGHEGKASVIGHKSGSTTSGSNITEGTTEEDPPYLPPKKSKTKSKAIRQNEESSPHAMSAPSALVKKERTGDKYRKSGPILHSSSARAREDERNERAGFSPTTIVGPQGKETNAPSFPSTAKNGNFRQDSPSSPLDSLRKIT